MVPPFRPVGSDAKESSWAFVKNPCCPTAQAWTRCLAHEPRCISWTAKDYAHFHTPVDPVPRIALEDLLRYSIGSEADEERESSSGSLAVWIGRHEPVAAFAQHAARYSARAALTLDCLGLSFCQTPMKLMEHLAMKIVLNTVSTVSMAELGRLTSNYMTWMDMSNKKLVDRCARLIVQECGVTYEAAAEELFYSKQLIASGFTDSEASPVQVTIRRLKKN